MKFLSLDRTLKLYFYASYLLVLLLVSDTIPFSDTYNESMQSFVYLVITFFLYGLLYLIPAIILTMLSIIVSKKTSPKNEIISYVVAILSGGITTLLLYANAKIFSLYGMYINGFIINLLTTPGGIESLGGSRASDMGFALIAGGFFVLQAILLWFSHLICTKYLSFNLSFRRLPLYTVLTAITAHMWFAFDHQTTNQLVAISESIPFYQTVSARRFFKLFGLNNHEAAGIRVKGQLHYPLNPIQTVKTKHTYNIIWLTSESWRADSLNETIMPNTWKFAQNSARFTRNYSGGNGTRMGVFSMFTGLPGSYWFSFLAEHKGAAIIDLLKQKNYQMRFFTSARFSYPEFDQTIFAKVPKAQLQETRHPKTGWENDESNVTDLISYIDQRDTNQPFFTFMFFESPHARYYFPPETAIAKPYRNDLNYATLSKEVLSKDIHLIKNRYINSVHHLDIQFGRIFEYLKAHQLLKNTIVVMVGDHGEEFMENGYWGHNSTFADPQVRTPLVIYTPETEPKTINEMTSHMDIIPSIMPLLGVTNPVNDYALGYNILKNQKRSHTYIADWNKIGFVDDEVKISQPVNGLSLAFAKATTGDDKKLSRQASRALIAKKQNQILQMQQDLSHFFKKKAPQSTSH